MTYLRERVHQLTPTFIQFARFLSLFGYLNLVQMIDQVWAETSTAIELDTAISLQKVDQHLGHEFWRITKRVNHGEQKAFNITAMANAPKQELWLGTPSGLLRYDGISFETIDLKANLDLKLPPTVYQHQNDKKSSHHVRTSQETAKFSKTQLTTLSSITSLTELLPSHDLLIGIQGQGVWRYHIDSVNQYGSKLTRVSRPQFKHITPFHLSVVDNKLYISGTHGLSALNLNEDSLNGHESLIDGNAVFNLAWLGNKGSKTLAYACGKLGISFINSYRASSELIFSRSDEGKACRGIVALPVDEQFDGDQGHFALFEDRLYYVHNQQVFRVASPELNVLWGQKPYIDQSGQLWVPTHKALLRYGHYRDIRRAALQGELIRAEESLAIINSKALHQLNPSNTAPSQPTSIWLTNPEQRLLKITRSQGKLLLPKTLQSSGAGPIIRTQKQSSSARLWWVESCNKIYTTRYRWLNSAEQTTQKHFTELQSLHLARRQDGECVDALAGLDEPHSPLVIARRNEIWALDSQDLVSDQSESAKLEVKFRKLWSRPCDSLDCRISALHIHSVQPLIVFAGTESGQVFRLSEQAEPKRLAVKSTEQHSAIKVIKESRHGLLIGHAQGLSLVKLDQGFNMIDELDLSRLPHLSLPRAPIRDVYKDQDHQIWWIASYGDGLAWLDLSDIQQPKAGRFKRLLKGANRFLSGLTEIVDPHKQKKLWLQSNQGLIHFPVSKLFAWAQSDTSHQKDLGEEARNLVPLDEANGWLRPSFTHLGPMLVAATTQQCEMLDTRSLHLSLPTLPPKFVSATWRGTWQGQSLVETQMVKKAKPTPKPSEGSDQKLEAQIKAKQTDPQHVTLLAPEGADELELALFHPLGVNQPVQSLLYRIRRRADHDEGVWNKLRLTNKLSFAHMKPGQYKVELKALRNSQESKVMRQINLVIPDSNQSAEQQWFWSLIFFSLGSGLLVSSLIYRENRSLKIEAKTHEIASKQNKNFLNHYKSVFEQSSHALLLFSEHGSCLEWNPKALELFGLTAQEMNYVLPQELGLSLPKTDEDFNQYRDLSLLCKKPFGSEFPARINMSLHIQKFGHSRSKQYILVSVIDLSSLIQTQDQLLKEQSKASQLKRLESLGRLAGSVAHEMNNTFGEVEGLLEAVEEELRQLDYSSERLSLLKMVSQKGHMYVQQLLNVANKHPQLTQLNLQEQSDQKQELAYHPVTQLFEEELKHFSWLLSQEQSLEFEYLKEPIEDDDLLGRAFDQDDKLSSTLIHPEHYLIHRPLYDHFTFRLVLLLSERMTPQAQLKIQQGLSYGKTLIFRVSLAHEDFFNLEQGPWATQNGIFDEQLAQLKLQVETLGASLTQEFAPKSSSLSLRFPLLEREKVDFIPGEHDQLSQELQELIDILNDLHEPDTIDAYPTLDSEQKSVEPKLIVEKDKPVDEASKQSTILTSLNQNSSLSRHLIEARVLLVDDNETLLKILNGRLQRKNYEVYPFSDSKQAQAFIESMGDQSEFSIDVLVTDVLMPHINGRQLADRFHEVYPDLPVIFMSAYTDAILSPDGEFALKQKERFMRKPFSPKELIKMINEMLTVEKPDGLERESEPLG